MRAWLAHHFHALGSSTGRLFGNPLSSLLNIAVIGIAFSFPVGLYAIVANVQLASPRVGSDPQLTMFMALAATADDVDVIRNRLKNERRVSTFRFIPRNEAWQRLQQTASLGNVTSSLDHNPLPDAFVVEAKGHDPLVLQALRDEFKGWPKIEHVQLDALWAQRLAAGLRLGRLAALILIGLLGFALVAATFNTIRLQILTRREEIEVSKLIGATNTFIRRPFLYYGTLQGLIGGAVALGIVAGSFWLLNDELAHLAALYGSQFQLRLPDLPDSLTLLAFAAVLGWLGAWLSVGRHLRRIDPHWTRK
jgi:cell division transport system permease protein